MRTMLMTGEVATATMEASECRLAPTLSIACPEAALPNAIRPARVEQPATACQARGSAPAAGTAEEGFRLCGRVPPAPEPARWSAPATRDIAGAHPELFVVGPCAAASWWH